MTARLPVNDGTRPTGKPKRVASVESQPCPARDPGGYHFLTNRGALTCCRFCGASWAALDEAVRAG